MGHFRMRNAQQQGVRANMNRCAAPTRPAAAQPLSMRSCCIAAVLLLLRASAAQPLAKRGTGYDFRDVSDLAALHRISWYYNWAVAEVANVSAFARDQKIEFVPMQVGVRSDLTVAWRHVRGCPLAAIHIDRRGCGRVSRCARQPGR